MSRRALDWFLILALTGSWALLLVRAVDDALRTGRGRLDVAVFSSAGGGAYPTLEWGTRPTRLLPGDELTAVGDVSLRGASELRFYDLAIGAARQADFATVSAMRAGAPLEARLELAPNSEWWVGAFAFSALLLSGIFLLAGAPHWHLARRYALACWCFAAPRLAVWGVGPPAATFFEATFLCAGWGVGSVLTVWYSQDFTRSAQPVPIWQRGFALLPGALYGAYYLSCYWSGLSHDRAHLLLLAAIASMAVAAPAGLTRTYLRSRPIERRQIRWVVLGYYVALGGTTVTAFLLTYSDAARGMARLLGALPVLAIPLGMTISVVGYRWLDVDRLIAAAASYTIVGIGVLGGALALVPRAASAVAPLLGVDPAVVQWLLTLALVLAAIPVHLALRPQLDRRMFAERHARMSGFARLLEEVEHCSSPDELLKLTSERIHTLLEPESFVVFARDGNTFVDRLARGRAPVPPFEADSLLVRALARRGKPLAADSAELDPFDRAALETLGVSLVIPIRARDGVLAFACLGPKRSRDIYTPEEKAQLAAVATRCAEMLGPPAPETHPQVFRRDGDIWTIAALGKQIQLRDMRGLHYLATLLREPGREFAALDLVGAASGLAPTEARVDPELRVARRLGDAGPLLDAQARSAYRERVNALNAELADAERCADLSRLERASAEREALLAELESAGRGRDRRAGSDAERARVAVTKAIKVALEKIAERHPELGANLADTVRRGYLCAYEPDPRSSTDWAV